MASKRIISVDALRGFDMFWIIGAASLVQGLQAVGDAPWLNTLAIQLTHVEWEGFRFYDLIFPLFVFTMGVSTVFSLSRHEAEQGRGAAYRRLIRRAVLLYAIGLFYYGARSRGGDPEMFRFVGVLQRIAFCYLVGGLLFLNLRLRGLVFSCLAILIGYWALLTFVPVGEHGPGNLQPGKNLANYVDQRWLPGYKWDGDWDPEGLLSNIPAVATGLLGIFAGMILQEERLRPYRRVRLLVLLGAACLAAGWLWSFEFPVIKKIWTSSYVLVAGGWSYLLLAFFYLVIDVWKIGFWARPFVWIGMNAITIYLLQNLLPLHTVVRRVVHQPLIDRFAPYGDLLVALLSLGVAVGVCYWLYRQRIFLRV